MAVPVEPWPRKGGFGSYIILSGSEGITDAYVCEIPPGKSLLPQKHLYEELIYILSGYGATTVWAEGTAKHTFEWQPGSLFSPPLNTWHQHFNGQSDQPVRYIGATRAPISMNLFHDLGFIFKTDYVFKERYGGEEDYFTNGGKSSVLSMGAAAKEIEVLDTNFVPNCKELKLREFPERGAGGATIFIEMSNNVHSVHISRFPVGTYKKAHRHGHAGSRLIILSGQGFTLIWPAEGGERVKIPWQENSLFGFPNGWFHQHFNTGPEPAKYMSFQGGTALKYRGIAGTENNMEGAKSVKQGGRQIEYEDEDPEIRRSFKQELAKNGVPWRMSQYFPGE
jgi:uncharacterized RmlC-like cupin family protein